MCIACTHYVQVSSGMESIQICYRCFPHVIYTVLLVWLSYVRTSEKKYLIVLEKRSSGYVVIMVHAMSREH